MFAGPILIALLSSLPGTDLRAGWPTEPASASLRFDVGRLAEPQVTKTVLLVAASALILQELVILEERDRNHIVPTISQVLRETGSKVNVVPFLGSALVTHWWLNHDLQDAQARGRGRVFLGLSLAFVAWDVKCAAFGASGVEKELRNPPYLAVALGLLSGYYLWPQDVKH
jgi:hypothetical protein